MKYSKWIDKNIPSLENKTVIVTGANSGIGFQLVRHLAYKKAHVIMACRNKVKADKARKEILDEFPDASLECLEYDQASFSSIASFVSLVKEKYSHIDALVCNAGVYFPKANYQTRDGYELTLGTNYLGTYKLIDEMKEKLNKDHSRVVIMSSFVGNYAKKIPLSKGGTLTRNKLYNYSKALVARLGYELSLENNDISYRIVHPGICSTNIISSEQTGFPTWFGVMGHRFLTLFTHSAEKASLIPLLGVSDVKNNKNYITPGGIFSLSGYPKKKNYPSYVKEKIIEETRTYLKGDTYVTNN